MPEIKVFRAADGRIAIRWPKGQVPDKATVKRLFEAIKSPSANGNSQKGSTENGAVVGHSDITASAAESQEGGQQNG